MRLSVLLATLLCLTNFAMAESAPEPHRRLVNFEWEEIPSAKAYELLIKTEKNINGETSEYKFIVDSAAWSGKLIPGTYSMKLRSLDHRKVPGNWSEPSQFSVALDTVALVTPAANNNFSSESSTEEKMEFSWKPVAGADFYTFEISSDDSLIKITKDIPEANIKLDLPVAKKYTWKVSAHNKNDIHSEATSVAQFQIMGKPIQAPKILQPENEFVRELTWEKIDYAESYTLNLVKYNPETKKWQKIATIKNHTENKYTFPNDYSGGQYQLLVTPVSPLRPSPKPQKVSFTVANGDRSPASEYRTLIRQSIDRTNGWYMLASYMVTNIEYRGKSPELNSHVNYNALGGTLRLGGGYMSPKSEYGFNSIVDFSGFNFEGSVKTYSGLEVNGIYRRAVGTKGEFRALSGPYYRELPETMADSYLYSTQDNKVSVAGLHAGAEYWYSFNPKVGLQVNYHMYLPVAKIDTPNGKDIGHELSTSLGFMGSYRWNKSTTLLGGYTFKEENFSYKSTTGSSSYADENSENSSTIKGHYVNLYVEWSF